MKTQIYAINYPSYFSMIEVCDNRNISDVLHFQFYPRKCTFFKSSILTSKANPKSLFLQYENI